MYSRLHKGILLLAILMVNFVFGAHILNGHVSAAMASDFKDGRIIDDSVFQNKNATTPTQLQALINSMMPVCDSSGVKTSEYGGGTRAQYGASKGNPIPFTCLKEYYEVPKTSPGSGVPASNYGGQPIPAGAQSAAQLIWQAGQDYGINPQALLVTLQKESGLVTDEWPFKNQYLYAMGAHCPDGPNGAECDPNYAGFSLQIRESARLFRLYLDNMNQPWWTHAKPGINQILYQVAERESTCGKKTVNVINASTAALYTYTPYTPNAAALANLYGTGDYCSAYGNRNFWRMFTDWYGTTLGDSYVLVKADNGDLRQWLLMNGKRYYIPDPQTLKAWGLDKVPLFTLSGAYIGSFPDGSDLTRLMRPPNTLNVYFVDSGHAYRLIGSEQLTAWGLGATPILDVPQSLANLPDNQGDLTYTVQPPNDTRVFLMDGGTLRHIQNPETLDALEGAQTRLIGISSDYFTTLQQGTPLTTPRIISGNKECVVSGRTCIVMKGDATSSLYPWTAQTVSSATINRLPSVAPQVFLKSPSSTTIFLLDAQQKHQVSDPDIMNAWQTALGTNSIITAPPGLVNLIQNGAPLNDYLGSNGGLLYSIDGLRRAIPSSLVAAYTAGRSVFTVSSALLAMMNSGTSVSDFVKAANDSRVYLLSNSGKLKHILSPTDLLLWAGPSPNVTSLNAQNINKYTSDGTLSTYVGDGTNNYVLSGGTKLSVSSAASQSWGLGTPTVFSDNTLSRFAVNSSVLPERKAVSGSFYFFIQNGKAYATVDRNIAKLWGIDDALPMDSSLINQYLTIRNLTRLAKSSQNGDSRLFAVDKGSLYYLSPQQIANLGLSLDLKTEVNPEDASLSPITNWSKYVVKNETDGQVYVIDNGKKRLLPSGIILAHWTSQAPPLVVSSGFVGLIPDGPSMERAIKGSAAPVYSAENATKRWIISPQTFSTQYAPYTIVSDILLQLMPEGAPIN